MSEKPVKEQKNKKHYVKPETKKHKAAAIVSGSGDCSLYSRTVSGLTYYY